MTTVDHGPLLFGADFADYPIMQEVLAYMDGAGECLVGGRSGLAHASSTPQLRYFDWQPYQRREQIPHAFPAIVDPEREQAYAQAWRQFARSLDRVFLDPLPAREAEAYFWSLCAGLENWCRPRAKRLIVFFAHTPHFPWHIVFFHVCRQLEIPAYVFKRTQTPDGMFLDRALVSEARSAVAAAHPLYAESVLDELHAVSGRLQRSREINRAAEGVAAQRPGISVRWRLLRRLFRNRSDYRFRHYFRQPWWRLYVFAMRRAKQRLSDFRDLRARAQDAPEGPYVYFALHYQPERTTVPEADFFHDQIRAVTALASALPAGYRLAVKEHPRQLGDLRPDLRCLHYSRRALYREIDALDNVVLLDAFQPSAELIDKARLIASCNGSSVFEGLQRGVAGLTFVRTWHSNCDSAPVANIADLKTQVACLVSKSPDTVRTDFETFVATDCRYWFHGANDDRAAELSSRERDVLLASMRAEIAARVSLMAPANRSDDP